MSKALITGGTGFIGSHVVRRVLQEGLDVRCLVRSESNRANLEGLTIEITEGDLSNPLSMREAMRGCQMLFHVAADYRLWARNPGEIARNNLEGTRNVLQAAAEAGLQKIVYTSSVAAVGRPLKPHPASGHPLPPAGRSALRRAGPMGEGNGAVALSYQERGDPPQAGGEAGVGSEEMDPPPEQLIGPYKQSKFTSEVIARDFAKSGLPVVIVNPSAPIGSRDIKPTPTGKMIVDFLNGKMPAYVDTGMNFVDVEDVAAGHWLAAQKGKIGERYILGNKNMTLKEFLDDVGAIAGRPSPRIKIPYAVALVAGAVSTGLSYVTGKEPQIPLDGVRMAHAPMYYTAAKAVRELGLPQTPIPVAIEKAVKWFRENGYAR